MTTREQQIQARCQAATEGPWKPYPVSPDMIVTTWANDHGYLWKVATAELVDGGEARMDANAAFIAHAREDIPYLLARLAECEAALETAEAFIRRGAAVIEASNPEFANGMYRAADNALAALTKETSDV